VKVWPQVLLALSLAACGSLPAASSPTPAPTATSIRPTRAAATLRPLATAAFTPAPTETLPPPPAPPDPACCRLTKVTDGLTRPLLVTNAGDGRLFIVEQRGLIDVLAGGQRQTFLDLQAIVGSAANEQGLLGLAFHPEYAANGFFYVDYTDTGGNTVVARYRVSADPNLGDPASAQTLFTVDQPYENHNGGGLAFGPDGLLYIGMGDGGDQGDPHGNGQNPAALLGKLLRLNVDQPGAGPEIWALGLRNPWRFSFDRATGDLFLGDVGQNEWEEIDWTPRAGLSGPGPNFGWNLFEGSHRYSGSGDSTGLTGPIAEYAHSEGGCAVTGGYVYRGAALPALRGAYFFGDYCAGHIWTLTPNNQGWDRRLFLDSGLTISSFGEDSAGELYVVDHGGGAVYQLAGR
jgi:glucose/arabinose dehydrogenase